MSEIRPLIMCGGDGTRSWPLSRPTLPKPFAILAGTLSAFQQTIRRAERLGAAQSPLVVIGAPDRGLVEEQLAEIGAEADLLIAPEHRDSGPALLAGAREIARDDPDTLVLALAPDHPIEDDTAFLDAVGRGLTAAHGGYLVAFGICPTHPGTAHGYIQPGAALDGQARSVVRFAGPPDARRAARYLRDGYLWNAGTLLFRAGALIGEYGLHDPETCAAVEQAVLRARRGGGSVCLDAVAFGRARSQPIDDAILVHTARGAVVPTACGWSDIAGWDALRGLGQCDILRIADIYARA